MEEVWDQPGSVSRNEGGGTNKHGLWIVAAERALEEKRILLYLCLAGRSDVTDLGFGAEREMERLELR